MSNTLTMDIMKPNKSDVVIGIGELHVTDDPKAIIKTYALGSCIAVILYDNDAHIGAMAHIALPDSKIRHPESTKSEGYYADTAIDSMLNQMKKLNPYHNPKKIDIYITGGSNMTMVGDNFFRIGERNVLAAKSALMSKRYRIKNEETGSDISRTVFFSLEEKTILVKNQFGEKWLLNS